MKIKSLENPFVRTKLIFHGLTSQYEAVVSRTSLGDLQWTAVNVT